VQPAFSVAPPAAGAAAAAGGPVPITSGGVGGTASMATSVLRATKSANSAFAAATPARSLDLSSAIMGSGNSAAVNKRSAVGDLKPVVGRVRDNIAAALPPKKRLDSAVADSTGDAERDAYSSLARMRCVLVVCGLL